MMPPFQRPVMARAAHRPTLPGLQNRKSRSPSLWTISIRLMSPLGRLLRRHREQARLTQEELADRAGVSARTISDIERGVRARAYADTAGRLGVALGLTETDRAAILNAARGPNGMAGQRVSS